MTKPSKYCGGHQSLTLERELTLSHLRMIDGQVKEIRKALDEEEFEDVEIMSYSTKFASNFYGPFRKAIESTPREIEGLPQLSGRGTYQMDFQSKDQLMREIELDVEEGADIVMVKPAMPYLDVIRDARRKFEVPVSAYQVSGEYSMTKGRRDWMRGVRSWNLSFRSRGLDATSSQHTRLWKSSGGWMEIKVGTRGSELAVIQTETVVEKLKSISPNLRAEVETIKTSGDRRRKVTGEGVFVKEINRAVLDGKADIGVHSLKDLPTTLPESLSLSCVPERLDPSDVLVTENGDKLGELPSESTIGTGSPRRVAEISYTRKDLEFEKIRGTSTRELEKWRKEVLMD